MSTSPPATGKPAASTIYLVSSACVAALILGMALFLMIRGFQWRAAMAEFKAEPGIEIMHVERVGFFKKRLHGLRDPLAPSAEDILAKHNIGRHSAELALVQYCSFNTTYAEQREADQIAQVEAIKAELMKSVGEFADTIEKKREADMEKMTQMLFDVRFPNEMKSAQIEWKDGAWHLSGELYAPEHEHLIAHAPDYLIEGELETNALVNLTETRSASLKQDIETADLLATDPDGNFAHVERIKRLVADYDEVCARSNRPAPRFLLSVSAQDPSSETERLASLIESLTTASCIDETRILPRPALESSESSSASAFLQLVAHSGP